MTETDDYLIYSHEHHAWWKGNRHGYTNNLFDVGVYSHAEAQRICDDGNWPWRNGHKPEYGDLPAEVMVPLPAGFFTTAIDEAIAGLRKSVDEATTAVIAQRDTQRKTAR